MILVGRHQRAMLKPSRPASAQRFRPENVMAQRIAKVGLAHKAVRSSLSLDLPTLPV